MSIEPSSAPPSENETLGADLLIPALASALAAYYLVSTSELAWEARATGQIIAYVLIGLCALLVVRTALSCLRGRGRLGVGDLLEDNPYNRRRLALVGLLVVFILTIHWLGTTLGLFLLMIGSLRVMGVRSPREILGIAFAASAVVYLLFIYLLHSRLPHGLLENALARVLPPLGG